MSAIVQIAVNAKLLHDAAASGNSRHSDLEGDNEGGPVDARHES